MNDIAAKLREAAYVSPTRSAGYSKRAGCDLLLAGADEIERLSKAVAAEREACAQLVHDRLGADGYGVAQMIRARGNQ